MSSYKNIFPKCFRYIPLLLLGTGCKDPQAAKSAEPLPVQQPTTWSEPLNQAMSNDPHFRHPGATSSPYGPANITRNMLQDRNGNYWFATWEGIIRYDGKMFYNMTLLNGLSRTRVFSVLEDHNGVLWFGTIGAGVYRYDGVQFTQLTINDGLAHNDVQALLEDQAGNIWLGTVGGLSRYDGQNFTNFTTKNGMSSNEVCALFQDKTGQILIGFQNAPLCKFDGQRFSIFPSTKEIPLVNVRAMAQGKDGTIWLGTQTGLVHYDGKTMKKLVIDHWVCETFVACVMEDRTGALWFNSGEYNWDVLFRYDPEGPANGKPELTLFSAGKDAQGTPEQENSLPPFTVRKEGLIFKSVFNILEDNNGAIWMCTPIGVCRYNGQSITNAQDNFTNFGPVKAK